MTRHPLARLSAALALLLLAPAARAATVSGRLLDPAGAPVAGAKVVWEAYRTEEETLVDETGGTSPAPLGEIVTDAEGRFRVSIEKPGIEVSIRVLPGTLPGALLPGPYDSTEDVALDDVLLPSAEKVSGRVTDESGKPVGGARLRVVAGLAFEEEDVVFYSEATSGADGSYSIGNAPGSGGRLAARAAGYAPVTRTSLQRRTVESVTVKGGGTVQGIVTDPAGKAADGAIVLSGSLAAKADASGAFRLAGVSPGAQAVEAFWKADLAARNDTVRVKKGETAEVSLRLARAASVSGTVVDEKTRRPLAGVRVSASVGTFPFRENAVSRRTRTDAKGKFRVAGLAARPYVIRASKTDYLPVAMPGIVAGVSSPGSVSIALQKAAGISGRVTDENGAPVPGARVRLARDMGIRALLRGGPAALLGRPGVTTGPDGGFRLRGLAPQKNSTVEATKAGYVPAKRYGLTLKVGESVKDLALVVKRGLEGRGRVVDAAGQPIAGAEIRLTRPEGGPFRSMMIQIGGMSREKPDATSAADGSFRVAGLEPGEYAVSVSREGYAAKRVPSVAVQAEGPNDWPPIVLAPGAPVAGTVRGSKGELVVGAQVSAFGDGIGAQQASTDTEGRFRLEGFGADRAIMLNVRAEGYAPLQRNVTPPSEDLALTLKTTGTIRGRVEDATTNRPITDFTASYREPRSSPFGGMRVVVAGPGMKSFQSPDGSFELTDVPPGRWSVSASSPGYRPTEVTGVEVAEGETKEGVVLTLKKGSVVTGRVLDPQRGTGVPNASVSWRGPDGGSSGPGAALMAQFEGGDSSQATDADGRFRFEGLPAGKITLTAEHPDYLEVSRQVDAEDEETVDLTLSAGGSIAGAVVGKDGRTPVPGAEVSLDELGSTMALGSDTARADGSGNFLFEHLKAGRYRVTGRSNAGTSAPKEVVLAESQRLDGVFLQMAIGATLKGVVSGLPAERLGGVRVYVWARDYQDGTSTGDDGRFTLRDVPAGVLQVSASTAFPTSRSVSKSVEVPEGAGEVPVEIVFEGSSRLAGRVTRGERPLSGLSVSANPDPPAAGATRSWARTDENGQYAIEGLTDGSYQVSLNGQGVSYRRMFTIAGDTGGDIALPAVSISGFVTETGSNDPIEGAVIQADSGRESSAFTIKRAVSDSRGFYSIDDVDSGNYQITARREGYQLKTQSLSVASSSVELDLSLVRGAGLAIRAVDGLSGLGLRSVVALAYSETRTVAFQGLVQLDSDGKGEIASLAPGRYSLYIFSQGYAPRSFPAISVPSPTVGVSMTPGGRIEVRTSAPVTGRFVDASGALYPVSAWRLDGQVSMGPPASVWNNVAPGSYRLIVSGPSGESSYQFTVAEGQTTTVEVR